MIGFCFCAKNRVLSIGKIQFKETITKYENGKKPNKGPISYKQRREENGR